MEVSFSLEKHSRIEVRKRATPLSRWARIPGLAPGLVERRNSGHFTIRKQSNEMVYI
jgi:hypothetical protein